MYTNFLCVHGLNIIRSGVFMRFDHKERAATPIKDRPLGKLLNSLHIETAFYTASTLTEPWALEMPQMTRCMMYHLCVEGGAEFMVKGKKINLKQGDFILLPKGEGHILSDGQCSTLTPLAELPIKAVTERYETLEYGGQGKLSRLVCGVLLFNHPLAIRILSVLPEYIIILRSDNEAKTAVESICELMRAETEQLGVGADAVICRLSEVLVIAGMRAHLFKLGDNSLGWLNALDDDRIGRSLKLIHEAPEKHWSLEELAMEVGMSRTSFSQQFKRLVDNTPMDYLTEWRMSLAYSKLQFSNDNILTIALDIGYQSESAFSRAFKKVIGHSPGEVRRGETLVN